MQQLPKGIKHFIVANELSEFIIVELLITEVEDLEFIKKNVQTLSMGIIVSVEVYETTPSYYNLRIMVESLTQLYLLGRYVGCDRKRVHNLDF